MAEDTISLSEATFDQHVAQHPELLMVDFWAEWCAPCKMLAPTVEAIARDYNGQLRVAKLNVDENTATSERYGIRGIPTLLLFKGGQVRDQLVGNHPRANIERFIEKHLG